MPFYQFKCKECGKAHEAMCKWEDVAVLIENEACGSPKFFDPHSIKDLAEDGSDGCGAKALYKVLTPPNIIGETTGKWGVNGYYSKALGGYVDSPRAEEKIMNARGYIRESDLGNHGWNDAVEAKQTRMRRKEDDVKQIEADIAAGMDKGEAYAKTFSAERALSGELDNLYAGDD
jgi:hypothetical protein